MGFQPNSNLILTNTPCNDYKNVILFNTKQAQENYFKSRKIKDELDNFQYIRKENAIAVPFHIDELWKCNYIMYNNDNYNDKWFYAFVTSLEYVNDNVTKLHFETDVFQTWFFDCNFKRSFVVREHVEDDGIGKHTVNENLNVGEVFCEEETEDISLSEYFYVAVSTNWKPTGTTIGAGEQYAGITVYNKQIFGSKIYIFPYKIISGTVPLYDLQVFINRTNLDNHIDDINDMFIIPAPLIDETKLIENTCGWNTPDDHPITITSTFYELPISHQNVSWNVEINKLYNFSNFTPKNNKCYVYPYNYLFVSNNIGNQNIYKYEDFSNSSKATFNIDLALSIGVSGKLTPTNYKKISINDDESIPLAKYPTCSWSSDSYINWLTQNAINIPTNILSTAISLGTGIATKNATAITMSALNIANLIGEFYQASLMPNVETGQNTGNINYSANRNTFSFKCMRAKDEYLKIIDDYFTLYGYKVNELKIPNLKSRKYWNYIQTIDCNITANIPTNDLSKIKEIFNSGVTIWHDTNNLYDYSLSNSIV